MLKHIEYNMDHSLQEKSISSISNRIKATLHTILEVKISLGLSIVVVFIYIPIILFCNNIILFLY